jgi:tRNA/rRNA methyltransferase
MADCLVNIPTSEVNPSLNIAQAIGLICYEIFNSAIPQSKSESDLATKAEVEFFFNYLEQTLEDADFFKNKKIAYTMKQNIRNMFIRCKLSSQDVRTLMGMFKSLHF